MSLDQISLILNMMKSTSYLSHLHERQFLIRRYILSIIFVFWQNFWSNLMMGSCLFLCFAPEFSSHTKYNDKLYWIVFIIFSKWWSFRLIIVMKTFPLPKINDLINILFTNFLFSLPLTFILSQIFFDLSYWLLFFVVFQLPLINFSSKFLFLRWEII